MRPKMKKTVCAVILAVFAVFGAGMAWADGEGNGGEGGENIIHIYHDYYIPWAAGAGNCYGAYRLAVTDGEAYRTLFDGGLSKSYSGGWKLQTQTPEPLAYSQDIRNVRRDDLVVITDFALGAYREEHIGNEIHHHTYYYETPYLFAGVSVLMNPVHGVAENAAAEGLSHIVLTRKLAHEYFKEDIGYESFTRLLVPGFGGANPNGSIVRHVMAGPNHHKYILSLNPSLPEMVGWWRMLSVETLSFINEVRKDPAKHVRTPTAAELAEIEAAKKKAYGEERTKNPAVSPAPFDAGYDFSAPRVFYSPEMFWMFHRQRLEHAGGAKNVFAYGEKFLSPFDMHHLWQTTGDKVAAGLFGSVPEPETAVIRVDVKAASGWRIGKTSSGPLEVTKVVSEPQPVVGRPPFTEGAAFDMFRTLHPGTWGTSGQGTGGVSITTYAPELLARWPFGYAQAELHRMKKTSRDRLSGDRVEDRDIIGKITSSGGMMKYVPSSTGWTMPTANIDGSDEQGIPVQTEVYASYEPAVVAPGKTPSGKSAWEIWASRDRNFYDSVMPYLSSAMGLLFWEDAGLEGLYLGQAIERRYAPEIMFSRTGKVSNTYGIDVQRIQEAADTRNSWFASSKEYGAFISGASAGIRKAVELHNAKVSGKDKTMNGGELVYGQVVRSGNEHISRVTRSTIRYIPMRKDAALAALKRNAYVDGALKGKVIDIPENVPLLDECRLYFPIEGTVAKPESWAMPVKGQ